MRIVADSIKNNFTTTFLSVEKYQQEIWEHLLVKSQPYSDKLKRLLLINTPDCLDPDNLAYQKIIEDTSVADMRERGIITNSPQFMYKEHEEMKSLVYMEFDNIMPSSNPQFRNMTITFMINCNLTEWELDDFKMRPYQIAGYIDGIMSNLKLGIGKIEFHGCSQIVFDSFFGGLMLYYYVVNPKAQDLDKENPDMPALQQLGNIIPLEE